MDTALISNIAMTLAMVLSLFVLMAFLAKKTSLFRSYTMKELEVIGGTNISKRSKIVLIKVMDKKLLLGVSDNNINTLYAFEEEAGRHEISGNTSFDKTLAESLLTKDH